MGAVEIRTDPHLLAELVVESLQLEGVKPEDLDITVPLFANGLGLDSLDLLELSLAIEQRYGVKLTANNPGNERIFSSLECLAEHINARLGRMAEG